jgi:ParB family transcriptional regulator, chromosome partitioning protein
MQNSSAFQYLAIDTIHESTTNPRHTFDESKLQELAESIRHHGLIQPITVRPNSEGFELVAGARRYRAAQLAELFSIPARIVELTDGPISRMAVGREFSTRRRSSLRRGAGFPTVARHPRL